MPHPTTFKSIAEPTYGVMRKATFLVALDTWAKRPAQDFSKNSPPVDQIPDQFSDENAELAAIFYRLTRAENLTAQIALIQLELFHHNRHYSLAWDQARGETDPRHRPQRTSFFALRPYEDLIAVIENWADALHDRACEVRW